MKTKTHFKRYALAALIAGFSMSAIANQEVTGPSPEELAAQAAEANQSAALAGVAADRYGTIAGIVAVWAPSWDGIDGWEADITAALNSASNEQLVAIQGASSYDAVRAILQGQPAPVSLDGVSGTEDLGSLTQDLVYSPVFPCRIFDTREVGAAPTNGAVRSYYVYGSGALMTPQGGNAAGCPAPTGKGEPVGISVNMAAVPVSSSGHLRVYPYLGTRPNASFLNYFGGGNIANSGLITTCYNCGREISVYNRNTAHSFGDVMGYFYAARLGRNTVGQREINTADLDSGTNNIFQTLVAGDNFLLGTTTTPNDTGKCYVTATGQISGASTDTSTSTYLRTARKVGAAAATNDGTYGQYFSPIAGRSYTTSLTATNVWAVAAGSQKFGCYIRASGDLVGNSAACRVSYMCF